MSFYSSLYRSLILAPSAALRGRKFMEYQRLLEASQWWSRDRLEAFQWDELKQLVDTAYRTVPYYQELFKKIGFEPGDLKDRSDYRRLPVLRREDLIQNRERLSSSLVPPGCRLPHATGGSSGVPVRFYRTIDSYDWRVAATRRAYGWTGHELGEPTLYLWGAPVGKVKFVPKWRSRIADSLSRTAQVPTFLQTGEVWAQVAERARAVRPRFMVGYASSLLNFARYAEQNGLKFDGLVSVISAAEGLQDAARAYVQRVLGAPVFNTYGSREFMSIGVECDRHCGMHVNSENVLVETADGDSDASAPLLVTDLHNLGTVFLRYAIGDAGAITAAPCACGRALPRLTSLGGRTLDVLTLANGSTVNALYFFHLLKEIPEILAFQIKQTEPNALEARVVLSRELSEASRTLFETETKKVVGDARIELRRVDELETGASGKVKVVIGLGRTA